MSARDILEGIDEEHGLEMTDRTKLNILLDYIDEVSNDSSLTGYLQARFEVEEEEEE